MVYPGIMPDVFLNKVPDSFLGMVPNGIPAMVQERTPLKGPVWFHWNSTGWYPIEWYRVVPVGMVPVQDDTLLNGTGWYPIES